VARSETGNNVVYVHAGQQVFADYARGAAAAAPSFRYVYGSYVDEPLLRHAGTGTTLPTSGTAALYYHRNQQYSIVGLSDAAGTLVERYAYTAYGELTILAPDRTLRATSSFQNRYTYTGREWDAGLSLYYFRARWLEPKAGRFIGRDPLGYVDGMGLYGAYFGLSQSDPQGKALYAIDGTWADESPTAREAIRQGQSNVKTFHSETAERPRKYYPGTGSGWFGTLTNGATGFSNRGIIREVYHAICDDFCESKAKCEKLEINLVGWSRGAVAAVEVADWLNHYGCKCKVDPSHWLKTQFRPVTVNFLGLFDPVSMHLVDEAMQWTPVTAPFAFWFEDKIPPNVNYSAALYRTAELGVGDAFWDGTSMVNGAIFPQMKYKGLNVSHNFFIYPHVGHEGVKSTHGDAGRHPEAYEWMKQHAIQAGVDF
jgi:RHS repeat-associated protein